MLPTRWQWWEDGAHDGTTNMAIDEALRATVRAGVGVWRWYAWTRPTVSFGRNERTAGRYSAEWLVERGLNAVRRPTGGRALLHDHELTYSVTLPLAADIPWRHAYDAVNALLFDALRTLNIDVRRSAGAGPVIPDGPVCFDQPAAGELTVDGRKLVGSAVWRQGDAYLQHGSILLRDDQHRLAGKNDTASSPPPAAALTALRPDMSEDRLRGAVHGAARTAVLRFASVDPFVFPSGWADVLASQHRHFADTRWLWRR